jgi:hypothetical protein
MEEPLFTINEFLRTVLHSVTIVSFFPDKARENATHFTDLFTVSKKVTLPRDLNLHVVYLNQLIFSTVSSIHI